MGRHTRFGEPDDDPPPGDDAALPPPQPPADERPRRRVPVPLLPILALTIAIGVVSYAYSTKQISLNFAPPAREPKAQGIHDSQVSQRRRSARADGLVVDFALLKRQAGAFTASVTVTNRGERAVRRWALAFTIPKARVVSATGAEVVALGRRAWVRSPGTAPALEPGASVRVVFRATGAPHSPSTCVLNRVTCDRI
ncbi:cellulose binding domain-containing protein [Actinomadura rayongensis]|uniref:CBM2 domain-containing protein n=1 Tax=Actinomadura rayongensis TaxID=1429076 RepID=A0A6I4VYQ1_9ACTN|nr:cellulose binding domain-containing protein [Actinomadura rayongensis]MXQ63479.1 hypothetical protein [Actinomadura rayongensis]